VIKIGEFVMILELHRQGVSVSAIARQLGLDRKTVRAYIAKGLEPPTPEQAGTVQNPQDRSGAPDRRPWPTIWPTARPRRKIQARFPSCPPPPSRHEPVNQLNGHLNRGFWRSPTVRAGEHCKQAQQRDFLQRIHHLAALSAIWQILEMIQKNKRFAKRPQFCRR
jgi:hypothetical protein